MMTSGENRTIRELIAARRNGHCMPREFYGDELIYCADIARIWRRGLLSLHWRHDIL